MPLNNSSSDNTLFNFSPSCLLLAYFHEKKNIISLYDVQKKIIVHEKKLTGCTYIKFLNDSELIYLEQKQHYLWNVNADNKKPIKLAIPSGNRMQIIKPNLMVFIDKNYYYNSIYALEKNTTYTLSPTTDTFEINKHATYAIGIHTQSNPQLFERIATIYNTTTGDIIDSYSVFLYPYDANIIQFSPCGKFVIVAYSPDKYLDLKEGVLSLYDIEQKKIILKRTIPCSYFKAFFHQDDYVIFLASETMLVIYNYHTDTPIEITTKEKITHFAISEDLLTISMNNTTNSYDISGISYNRKNMYTFNQYDVNFKYL